MTTRNKYQNGYAYNEENQTAIQLTFPEFLSKLGADFSIISNFSEEDIKLYLDTHQQIYVYLQKLKEKKYIIDVDMGSYKMIVNPETLNSTPDEDQNLLDEFKQYIIDTMLKK